MTTENQEVQAAEKPKPRQLDLSEIMGMAEVVMDATYNSMKHSVFSSIFNALVPNTVLKQPQNSTPKEGV